MTLTKLGVPKWGLSMKEGRVVAWLVDEGAEVGGPIVRDHFWAWGAYARSEIDLRFTRPGVSADRIETRVEVGGTIYMSSGLSIVRAIDAEFPLFGTIEINEVRVRALAAAATALGGVLGGVGGAQERRPYSAITSVSSAEPGCVASNSAPS